ncbi:hypothetical protein FDECE_8605 [Fusarium decemcellulare]|nr:hypothetical protein FDECE_8605 [Fusarium decemcellulare]
MGLIKDSIKVENMPLLCPRFGQDRSAAKTYLKAAIQLIRECEELLILSCVEGRNFQKVKIGLDHLPSWVPDWSDPSPLGLRVTGLKRYSADACFIDYKGGLSREQKLSRWPAVVNEQDLTVSIRGFKIDKISFYGETKQDIEERKPFPRLLNMLLSLPVQYPTTNENRLEALWRTLIANTGGNACLLPPEYPPLGYGFAKWLWKTIDSVEMSLRDSEQWTDILQRFNEFCREDQDWNGLETATGSTPELASPRPAMDDYASLFSHGKHLRPFLTEKGEIRLLEILSQSLRDKVVCRLHTVSLDTKPEFVCLSYVWGDESITEEIIVDGVPVQVTVNLATALKHVKKHWVAMQQEGGRNSDPSNFRLWADAVCINQADLAERSAQVQLMRELYTSADAVFAWLSSQDKETAEAIDIFQDAFQVVKSKYESSDGQLPILDGPGWERNMMAVTSQFNRNILLSWISQHLDALRDGDAIEFPSGNPWGTVYDLTRLPFWSRVWIQQEMILAGRLYYMGPSNVIPSGKFQVAIFFLYQMLDAVYQLDEDMRPLVKFRMRGLVMGLGAIFQASHMRLQAHSTSHHQSVVFQASFNGNLKATRPVDYVYGLLGLNGLDIVPDYTKPVGQVYVEFTQKFLDIVQRLEREQDPSGTRSLKSLSYLGVRAAGIRPGQNLPTWVPAFGTDLSGKVRQRPPGNVNRVYGEAIEFWSCPDSCVVGDSLWVSAVKTHTVNSVYDKPISAELYANDIGSCLEYFLDSCGPKYRDGKSLLKVLCCTLFRSENPEFDLQELQWFLFLREQLNKRLIVQILEDGGTIPTGGPNSDALMSKWVAAAGETEGCSLPAVLRPEGSHYLFLGCCYVLGLMDGEVAELLSSKLATVQRVEIR